MSRKVPRFLQKGDKVSICITNVQKIPLRGGKIKNLLWHVYFLKSVNDAQ